MKFSGWHHWKISLAQKTRAAKLRTKYHFHTQTALHPEKVGKATDDLAWQTAQWPVVSVLQHHSLCLAHKAIPQSTWERPNQSVTESRQQENNCAAEIALSPNRVSWFSWHAHQTDSFNKSRTAGVWARGQIMNVYSLRIRCYTLVRLCACVGTVNKHIGKHE